MFNSSVQSWCPHFPQYLHPSKCFPGKPSQHEGCSPASPGAATKLSPTPAFLPPPAEGDILFSLRNLLGTSEAGCKPSFSNSRWFKRLQFVELLHEYLMIIFLGRLEAKNEGIDYLVMPIRGHASPRWGWECCRHEAVSRRDLGKQHLGSVE